MIDYQHEKKEITKKGKDKATGKRKGKTDDQTPACSKVPVHKRKIAKVVAEVVESDSDMDDDPANNCCLCNKFSPPGMGKCDGIVFVKWAQCTGCGHWCHLTFCTEIRVVRRHADFFCPHCQDREC